MSTAKTPRKGTRKATGSGRKGKANGTPVETSPPPADFEAAKATRPAESSADLDAFRAKLDVIRDALGEAIEIGIKLATRREPARVTDLTDDTVDPVTVPTPEPYPPTTQMIKDLVAEMLQHPDLWLEAPNPRFGGRKPADLLGTKDEIRIWWALRGRRGSFLMRLSACSRLPLRPITGHWYRALKLRYWETRLSSDQSLTRSNRFGAASPAEPGNRMLYLGENHQIVMYEVGALFGAPESPLSDPRSSWIILSLYVVLDHVADLTVDAQLKVVRTNHQELTGDWTNHPGVPPTHLLGAALFAVPNLEGFLFASSKQKGKNLVIFPDKLSPRSRIVFQNELTGKPESLN